VTARIFPTAQDAENAFYEALERCDLEGMMAVWAEDDEIICVHPTGPRLTGPEQIRESWARIFSGGPRARVHITNQVALSGMMLAVHSVHENFVLPQQAQGDARPVPIVATMEIERLAPSTTGGGGSTTGPVPTVVPSLPLPSLPVPTVVPTLPLK